MIFKIIHEDNKQVTINVTFLLFLPVFSTCPDSTQMLRRNTQVRSDILDTALVLIFPGFSRNNRIYLSVAVSDKLAIKWYSVFTNSRSINCLAQLQTTISS